MCISDVFSVADFGLSKLACLYRAENWVPPWQWVDMNFYETGDFNQWSDVWSFGIVLWELWSLGTQPYIGWGANFHQRLKRGERLSKPSLCIDNVYQLMRRCWSESPADRPDFQECYDCLRKYKEAYDNVNIFKC